ncbi:hypothetical protein [Nonomuraea gerenzanensis]|uniref:Uncharacterized protein n=1 Tax=Nonomuraea gerenzanensis TaxID=93944 RepID=A0A1M4E0N9_9ACTN|nr:hypothetical protein [Nonomuraea gerenzanensis]UBU14647.1 hypothetical protein LCN96_06365 [Nonomuraea gerenzanensis]SBO92365.1 hypothetical protein BN4615_P1879 [Nonomuraea gerenzanensis]
MDEYNARSSPAAGGRLAQRLVAAGLAGIILPFLQLGWLLLVAALPDDSQCGHFGCLGLLADAWTVGSWAAVVLAWPLLHLLGVRPAWLVAALAPFFLVPIWQLTDVTDSAVAGLFAYPLAALMSAPRLSWPRRTLVPALFLLLCVFLVFFSG